MHPNDVVDQFERQVAEYTGARFSVAVDSCTHALFLACKWFRVATVSIPKRTYVSVPCEIIHAGGEVEFRDEEWVGAYRLAPYPIWDAAKRFRKGMWTELYEKTVKARFTHVCVSFHHAKILPAGRGGMILHNDPTADRWYRKARFSGRHERVPLREDRFDMVGWHFTMDPVYAIQGLKLMSRLADYNEDQRETYPDLSINECFEPKMRVRTAAGGC